MRQNGGGMVRIKMRAGRYFRDSDVALQNACVLAKDDAIASIYCKVRKVWGLVQRMLCCKHSLVVLLPALSTSK